ncbi:pyridoxamine 5'-phosphate oxidase family protein [Rubrobacter tropicus]|uniref:Pyridoxamine 5'-phosphate oxidase family protein n=1 Tax=Rubrobacter tropicus TaxID=2653851 RepID=A0A6G8QDW6_9ACTN|nr:pyridoxamine 5'-phosphate oxidase family protein [Rubrobacter tropicus]QIN84669.1 pyridoxamine 5'-phosphate oxidase family protein [Rubrobacter tropicus]
MANRQPVTELDARFSSEDATPKAWQEGRRQLEGAEVYWLSTVRPDGSPHVTPLLAAWLDGALYFCTGPDERKAKNLARNPRCAVTTGCNELGEGLDVVVEGDAVRTTDDEKLRRVAGAYLSKYGEDWRFAVPGGAFYHDAGSLDGEDPGAAWVYEVAPKTVFGFGKGGPFSQTRWRF